MLDVELQRDLGRRRSLQIRTVDRENANLDGLYDRFLPFNSCHTVKWWGFGSGGSSASDTGENKRTPLALYTFIF